eukprot:13129175-Heterocapsa_arctica.AAC.1
MCIRDSFRISGVPLPTPFSILKEIPSQHGAVAEPAGKPTAEPAKVQQAGNGQARDPKDNSTPAFVITLLKGFPGPAGQPAR